MREFADAVGEVGRVRVCVKLNTRKWVMRGDGRRDDGKAYETVVHLIRDQGKCSCLNTSAPHCRSPTPSPSPSHCGTPATSLERHFVVLAHVTEPCDRGYLFSAMSSVAPSRGTAPPSRVGGGGRGSRKGGGG
eukprot:205028-Pyramimonas_sp.AAC.1